MKLAGTPARATKPAFNLEGALKNLPCRKPGGTDDDKIQKVIRSRFALNGFRPVNRADPCYTNDARDLINGLTEKQNPVTEVASQSHDDRGRNRWRGPLNDRQTPRGDRRC